MKNNIILISHGELSQGMANSAQMIVGKNENVSYYGLYPGGHPVEIINEIREKVEANVDELYIVVADLFGGSVCNGAMELLKFDNVRLLSGMNLPLVIDLLASIDTISDDEILEKIKMAQDGIRFISNTSLENGKQDNEFF